MPVNVLYRTSARATGGRDGHSATLDGAVDVKLVPCGGRAARAHGKLVVYTVWNMRLLVAGTVRNCRVRSGEGNSDDLGFSHARASWTTAKGSRKPLIK